MRRALVWRIKVNQLLAMVKQRAKTVPKAKLPARAAFYVSGEHHKSYGSTGHPYDVLAVTDDAADVTLFCNRKGMNAAFKVQSFKDVIRLVGTSIWTATPTHPASTARVDEPCCRRSHEL